MSPSFITPPEIFAAACRGEFHLPRGSAGSITSFFIHSWILFLTIAISLSGRGYCRVCTGSWSPVSIRNSAAGCLQNVDIGRLLFLSRAGVIMAISFSRNFPVISFTTSFPSSRWSCRALLSSGFSSKVPSSANPVGSPWIPIPILAPVSHPNIAGCLMSRMWNGSFRCEYFPPRGSTTLPSAVTRIGFPSFPAPSSTFW
mmetsp:Transcript_24303/g.68081  ORF Transcript_24303/g.68081 Transcript_24303/m.68081 type:complete len:200 (-) Transcript_24303:3239-3838(-)